MAAFEGGDLYNASKSNGTVRGLFSAMSSSSSSGRMDRVLNQFFGEFFAEDADEELASDMSERWAAFAKTSDPNHDGSKMHWGR